MRRRREWRGRVGIIACLVVLTGLAGGGAAQAAGMSSASGALHLRFARAVGAGVQAVVASKQYMLAVLDDGGYRIFDDARGRSWMIDQRPCGQASLIGPDGPPYEPGSYPGPTYAGGLVGAPWMLFYCARGGYSLYNITDRRWHTIGRSATSAIAFRDANNGVPFEVGAQWIKLTYIGGQDCGDHIHFGCGIAYRFYNIRSGTFHSSPTMSGSSVIDLDSPSLTRSLCAPLQAPATGPQGPMGTLALYGKVALEFTPYEPVFLNNAAPEPWEGSPGQWTLQRCGSNSRLIIDPPNQQQVYGALTANDHAVLWAVIDSRGTWHGEIAGRFLPTLQPLTASLPSKLAGDKSGPVLDSSHIYVVTRGGALWRAPFPARHREPPR